MHTLYLVQNKISHIGEKDLTWAKDTMKSLELGGNRLRVSCQERLVRLLLSKLKTLFSSRKLRTLV